MQVIVCESCQTNVAAIESKTQGAVADVALHIAGHALTKPGEDHVLNIRDLSDGDQISPTRATLQQQGKLFETMFVDGIRIPGHYTNVFGMLLAL